MTAETLMKKSGLERLDCNCAESKLREYDLQLVVGHEGEQDFVRGSSGESGR